MSLMLLAAAGLTVAIAMVHSVFGERRIFRRLRGGGEPRLSAFQVGILWASWHLVSLFGLALVAALFCLASPTGLANLPAVLRGAVIASMVGGRGSGRFWHVWSAPGLDRLARSRGTGRHGR